jgi:hypothetical protein
MSETEFPASLQAFCQKAVDELGYQDVDHVLDILDANFPVVRDRALDCCFDPGVAWAVLQGEVG